MTYQEKLQKAKELRDLADILESEAYKERQEEGLKKPISERLIYAAYARCESCGAGLAYDEFDDKNKSWYCSSILLGAANDGKNDHTCLPFAFYEVKSELQPSVNGATTRKT